MNSNIINLINNSKTKLNLIQIKKNIETYIKYLNQNKIEINYLFCDNNYILKYNKIYFKRNMPTDVIAFPFDNNEHFITTDTKHNFIGDIIISVEQVAVNARKYKCSFVEELNRVIIHGLLHLNGYDDSKKSAKEKMFELQEKILKDCFIL